jgi:heat shock transcription factor
MLEGEAQLSASSQQEKTIISWSDSGLAFRILDVEMFATDILPRYFRTKKFSSFQRNLNLVSS